MSIRVIAKRTQAFVVVGKALMKTQTGLREGLHEIGIIAKREVKRLIIEPPKTGRLYKVGGILHRASAAGEAPANLSGSLERSVGYKVSSPTQLIIGYRADHGKFLEHGTRNMAARPGLSAGAKNTAKEAENALAMAVDRKMKT